MCQNKELQTPWSEIEFYVRGAPSMWEVGRWAGKVFLNCYYRWVDLG